MTDFPVVLDDVTVRFGAHTALERISMHVESSTLVALIGPNAGGKTTLLRVILGLVRPTHGSVRVFGTPAAQLGERRARIGYVPQSSVANSRYPATTREVVHMGAIAQTGLMRRVPPDTPARVDAMLERVGLAGVAERSFHTLSGGERQRAIIARALVPEPKLLLLDEPTAGIDTAGQSRVLELLRDLQKDFGLTILMVSHHIDEMLPYVNQVACLNRTLHWHDRAELLSESVLREVYACELDAFFLKHHEHQAAFHTEAPAHTHDTSGDPTGGPQTHG